MPRLRSQQRGANRTVFNSKLVSENPAVSAKRTGDEMAAELQDALLFDLAYARLLLSNVRKPPPRKYDVDWCESSSGNSLLHLLAWSNLTGAISLLVEYGARVNATNRNLETPLHWAAARGNGSSARLLLLAGADPAHSDVSGCTPLVRAAEKGHPELMALLLHATPLQHQLQMPASAVSAVSATETANATPHSMLLALEVAVKALRSQPDSAGATATVVLLHGHFNLEQWSVPPLAALLPDSTGEHRPRLVDGTFSELNQVVPSLHRHTSNDHVPRTDAQSQSQSGAAEEDGGDDDDVGGDGDDTILVMDQHGSGIGGQGQGQGHEQGQGLGQGQRAVQRVRQASKNRLRQLLIHSKSQPVVGNGNVVRKFLFRGTVEPCAATHLVPPPPTTTTTTCATPAASSPKFSKTPSQPFLDTSTTIRPLPPLPPLPFPPPPECTVGDVLVCIEHCHCPSHQGGAGSLRHDYRVYSTTADRVLLAVVSDLAGAALGSDGIAQGHAPIRLFAMKARATNGARLGGCEVTVAVKVRSDSPEAQQQAQAQVKALGGTVHEGGWAVLLAHSKLSSGRWPRAGAVTRKVGSFVRAVLHTRAGARAGSGIELGGETDLGRNEDVMRWVLRLNGRSLPMENEAEPRVADVSQNSCNFPSPFHPPDPSLFLALSDCINAMLVGKGEGSGEGAFVLPMSAVLAAVASTSGSIRWPPGPIPVALLATCLRQMTMQRFLVFDSRDGTGSATGTGAGGKEAASPLSLAISPSPSRQDRPVSGSESVSASQSVFVALNDAVIRASGEGERDGNRDSSELGYADDWEERDSRPDRDCTCPVPPSPFLSPSPGQSPLGSLQLSHSEDQEQEREELP